MESEDRYKGMPSSLVEFLTRKTEVTPDDELPLPKSIKALIVRISMRAKAKQPEVKRGERMVDYLLAIRAFQLQDPAKRNTDSAITTRQELKAQHNENLYQKFALEEWLSNLPEENQQMYLCVSYFLEKIHGELKSFDYVDLDKVLAMLSQLIGFTENYLSDTPEHSSVLIKFPHELLVLIADVKNLKIRSQEIGLKVSPFKVREHLAKKIEKVKSALVGSNGFETQQLSLLIEELEASESSTLPEMIESYEEKLSELPVWNLVLPSKSSKPKMELLRDVPSTMRKWHSLIATLKASNSNVDFTTLNINSVLEEMSVFTDNINLLSRSLNKPYTQAIPEKIPIDLNRTLKSLVRKAGNVLLIIGKITPLKEDNNERVFKFDSSILPILNQLFDEYLALFTKVQELSKAFLRPEEVEKFTEVEETVDKAFDDIFSFAENAATVSVSENTPNFEQLDTDEIDVGLLRLANDEKLEKKLQNLFDELMLSFEEGGKSIVRSLELAQDEEKYNNELGPEVAIALDTLKKTLRRLIISVSRTFDERISMTQLIPELKEEMDKSFKLRSRIIDFIEEMKMGIHGFDQLFDDLMKNQNPNLALLLSKIDGLSFLMKKYDDLSDLFLDNDLNIWERMKKNTADFFSNLDGPDKSSIKVMSQKVSDFKVLFEALPRDINRREMLIVFDREKLNRARQAVNTARGLTVEASSIPLNDVSALLIHATVELLKCMDRDREKVGDVMMLLDSLISNMESVSPEVLRENLIQAETSIDVLIALV